MAAIGLSITVYLLIYFIIFNGCEVLIKFWVLANLLISISFTALQIGYIFFKHGSEGVRKAFEKDRIDSYNKSYT